MATCASGRSRSGRTPTRPPRPTKSGGSRCPSSPRYDPWPLADHRLLWICGDAAHLVRGHLSAKTSCHGCLGGWTGRRERAATLRQRRPRNTKPRVGQKRCHLRGRALDVKTLQDRPRLLPVKTVTLAYLVTRPAPSNLPYTRLPFERHVFRVTAAVTLIRPESDNDLHLVLSDGRRTMIAETPLGSCAGHATLAARKQMGQSAGCSTPLRKSNHHGRRLLRLLPRPNRRCPKRDRTAPSPRLRLPIEAGASAFSPSRDSTLTPAAGAPQPPPATTATTASAPKQLRRVLPGRLHPTTAARPQLRRHPLPKRPRHLQRP